MKLDKYYICECKIGFVVIDCDVIFVSKVLRDIADESNTK